MPEETKLVGVQLPLEWYTKIVAQLKPLETVQDYIRDLIAKDLEVN